MRRNTRWGCSWAASGKVAPGAGDGGGLAGDLVRRLGGQPAFGASLVTPAGSLLLPTALAGALAEAVGLATVRCAAGATIAAVIVLAPREVLPAQARPAPSRWPC